MSQSGIPARRSAAYLLDRIVSDGQLMSELLAAGALDRLSVSDRARAQRLALDVLRNMDRVDALIARHVPKPPPAPVRTLLRLGALELGRGSAAHGVVNDLVGIAARHPRHARFKGLVNAVLRKLAQHAAQDWDGLPVPRLPGWLRGPLVDAWGEPAMRRMERVHNLRPPVDLTPRTSGAELAEMTGGRLLPTGSVRLDEPAQISAVPGFETGQWWVQDAAAALPARLVRGARVLDLCAAPGGKTMQLAAAGHSVTAVDLSARRMERLGENLARTGLTAELRVCDARDVEGLWDAVLLDAPCSATGTIRRHPDLPFAKDGREFAALIGLQSVLIGHALSLLAPGGQLVFCTCSLLPDEGEVPIAEAIARHPGLTIDSDAMAAPWIAPDWRSAEGGLRIRPDMWEDLGGMDGFYIAALRKPV